MPDIAFKIMSFTFKLIDIFSPRNKIQYRNDKKRRAIDTKDSNKR